MSDETSATHDHHPPRARWTHVALRVGDIDATIDWYTSFTPLELLDRRQDDQGFGAWLGMPDTVEHPFILVVAQFLARDGVDVSPQPHPTLTNFAHLGIELPTRDDVDRVAARGAEAGCLHLAPTQLPPPVGYVCMLTDPDGNLVEFSWDQGVYATARQRWASSAL